MAIRRFIPARAVAGVGFRFDRSLTHRGLSVFIVEKPSTPGHDFAHSQPGGGKMEGRPIDTLGYRGMHSYEIAFDNWFVPDANVVGGEEGVGKGFYLQMAGFENGRIQTAARAVGLMQAAYEAASDADTFELLDVVGLDVSLAIQQTLYREFREPGFAPAPRLEHLVTAGYLGRKTGQFYGKDVRHRLFHDLIEDAYRQALREKNIRAVGSPQIETPEHQTGHGEHDHDLELGKDLNFTATVDGEDAPTFMMAPSLVGVEVPAGRHEVRFRYDPVGGYPLLLGLGLATVLCLAFAPRWRRRLASPVGRETA